MVNVQEEETTRQTKNYEVLKHMFGEREEREGDLYSQVNYNGRSRWINSHHQVQQTITAWSWH